MSVTTAWVKPPPQVGGLDHLAVQAPCINIYGRLLPGITNVTDRARYYTFYPWLIWAFNQQGFTTYDSEWVERFRRADVLFSLIAERHAAVSDSAYEDHAGAMVGSNTLINVAKALGESDATRLSDYSLRSGAKIRYFKNKLGGLGQYYLGVLRELAVLDGDSSSGIKYTKQMGKTIAEAMDAGINGDLFLAIVEADRVTADELDQLSAMCPCRLLDNPGEQAVLAQLFFARESFSDPEALPRRRTLQTILQLAQLLDAQGNSLSESTFRACVYSGGLPDRSDWPVPDSLAANRLKWTAYARNELLSIAVQGLFHALLDLYEESAIRLDSGAAVADWAMQQPDVQQALMDVGGEKSFAERVAEIDGQLPELADWQDTNHEVQHAEAVSQLSRGNSSPESRQAIVRSAIIVLLALAGREPGSDNPYGEFVFEERYFSYYPINLRSFQFHVENTWRELSVRDLLQWLFEHWGIDVHLRVALRKLRGQSQSTFRIRPSDRGLEVTTVPPAAHTRPRFGQAVRILKDIGALERSGEDGWKPSALGQSILELGDAP